MALYDRNRKKKKKTGPGLCIAQGFWGKYRWVLWQKSLFEINVSRYCLLNLCMGSCRLATAL